MINYKTPLTKIERWMDYLSILMIVLLFVYTARHVAALPETIPVNFGMTGEPDKWGSRWFVWLLPVVALFVYVILLIPDKLPHYINYPVKITEENAQRQYLMARMFLKTLKLAITVVLLILQWYTIKLALGQASSFGSFFNPVLLGIVFLPVLFYFYFALRAR
ncbi:DUF1648 domain-containing protein [candidate division KSB1 bacterium]|nr:DUF1648 domain-containing protein [candidate division KSB1 bacterium]